MKNEIKVIAIDSANYVDTNASSTLAKIWIGDYKDFDITIHVSGKHGLVYNIYTAPVDQAELYKSQTGGTLTSAVHSANKHYFGNNNMNWLLILASASDAETGSSLTNVIFSHIREET